MLGSVDMGSIGRLGRCRVPASRARGSENKVGGGQIDAGERNHLPGARRACSVHCLSQ